MYTVIPPQLRWACRRGMLELDLLLGHFLEEKFLKINEFEQNKFVELLDEPDPILFFWLTGKTSPDDADAALLINMIRTHAETRHHT